MFFTTQIRQKNDGTMLNNVHTFNTEEEALHQFYGFMSAYGNDNEHSYVRGFVMRDDGSIIRNDYADHRPVTDQM